jgi:hypothetical protein
MKPVFLHPADLSTGVATVIEGSDCQISDSIVWCDIAQTYYPTSQQAGSV